MQLRNHLQAFKKGDKQHSASRIHDVVQSDSCTQCEGGQFSVVLKRHNHYKTSVTYLDVTVSLKCGKLVTDLHKKSC